MPAKPGSSELMRNRIATLSNEIEKKELARDPDSQEESYERGLARGIKMAKVEKEDKP